LSRFAPALRQPSESGIGATLATAFQKTSCARFPNHFSRTKESGGVRGIGGTRIHFSYSNPTDAARCLTIFLALVLTLSLRCVRGQPRNLLRDFNFTRRMWAGTDRCRLKTGAVKSRLTRSCESYHPMNGIRDDTGLTRRSYDGAEQGRLVAGYGSWVARGVSARRRRCCSTILTARVVEGYPARCIQTMARRRHASASATPPLSEAAEIGKRSRANTDDPKYPENCSKRWRAGLRGDPKMRIANVRRRIFGPTEVTPRASIFFYDGWSRFTM